MDKIEASQCSGIAASLKVIGDKWSGLLVRQLTTGPSRFGTLQDALPGISPRTLSQRLDSLEEQKVITKTAYAEVPPRVEYALTKKGEDLVPILQSMAAWGYKYISTDISG